MPKGDTRNATTWCIFQRWNITITTGKHTYGYYKKSQLKFSTGVLRTWNTKIKNIFKCACMIITHVNYMCKTKEKTACNQANDEHFKATERKWTPLCTHIDTVNCKQYQLLCTNGRGGVNNTHTKRNIFNLQHCHSTQEVTSAKWDENTFQSFLYLFKYSKHFLKKVPPHCWFQENYKSTNHEKSSLLTRTLIFYNYPQNQRQNSSQRVCKINLFCKSWWAQMPAKECWRLLLSESLEARPHLPLWLAVALVIVMIHAGIIATTTGYRQPNDCTDLLRTNWEKKSAFIKHHYCCIQSLMSMSSGWRPTGDRLSSLSSSPSCWEGDPGSRSLPLLNPFSSSS